MKIYVFLLLSLLVQNVHILSKNQDNQKFDKKILLNKKVIDKKPKFIPKRMTDAEQQNLSAYIQKKLRNSKKNNNETLQRYERLNGLLNELISGQFVLGDLKDEKKYTDYFEVLIAELESLGKDPRSILQITDLRYKFLTGQLDSMPWFVKEIEALGWLFEQDAKKLMLQASRLNTNMSKFSMNKSQWPKIEDKALYVIDLVEQIERSHQRIEVNVLIGIMQTAQDYLVSFLPEVSNVVRRTIEEALNKLEKVRKIRDIPALKE